MIAGDVAAEVAKLKDGPGGDILVAGSAQLVQTLLQNGLVDELRLMVFPVALGAGKRLFADGTQARLRLVDPTPVGADGVVILTYEPVPAE